MHPATNCSTLCLAQSHKLSLSQLFLCNNRLLSVRQPPARIFDLDDLARDFRERREESREFARSLERERRLAAVRVVIPRT